MKRIFKSRRLLKTVTILVLIFVLMVITTPIMIKQTYSKQIFENIDELPQIKVAIVFGAGVDSDILKRRVEASVKLYQDGKVQKIIMSGDNRFVDYNEPDSMIDYAVKLGVPKENLQPDYAGRRTYDTCYRAKNIFGVDEAILITQEFHLSRAIYLCEGVGIKSTGFRADDVYYSGDELNSIREFLALNLAFVDLNVRQPAVVMGERIEI